MDSLYYIILDFILDCLLWMFETKLGHFLFNTIFCIIIEVIIVLIFPGLRNGFTSMVVGSTIVSIFFAIFDNNKRWV